MRLDRDTVAAALRLLYRTGVEDANQGTVVDDDELHALIAGLLDVPMESGGYADLSKLLAEVASEHLELPEGWTPT